MSQIKHFYQSINKHYRAASSLWPGCGAQQ
ncbi:hypothetical protein E2C01_046255 [Portunus trituberculatus]|uniref:Uncharacterized protein n=1 Tax=Portunus trituberculatus TaxID=210409 RepID=A0A5B7G467_PORTR|nr:hypothetical protein [Portunus trituberculatus]